MTSPRVFIGTLALNAREWLAELYSQHCLWKGLCCWCAVEAADVEYAKANPSLVTPEGLSVDGTTEYLNTLQVADERFVHIRHGFTSDIDPKQGKCQARNRYLQEAERVKPDFLIVCDADELYPYAAQEEINRLIANDFQHRAWMFTQRHIWRPDSIKNQPLFAQEVVGGYWSVPHCRVFRWEPGIRYIRNHNWPEDRHGRFLTEQVRRCHKEPGLPEAIHLGFASSLAGRVAKHRFYVARGEGSNGDWKRKMYTECRSFWESYQPGQELPHDARIIAYNGPIPEAFQGRGLDGQEIRKSEAVENSR